jgi:RHS repeat-associated protein
MISSLIPNITARPFRRRRDRAKSPLAFSANTWLSRAAVRLACAGLAYSLSAIVSFASYSATAPSGAKITGSYKILPASNLTIQWSVTGQSAVEPSGAQYPGQVDCPHYEIAVLDLSQQAPGSLPFGQFVQFDPSIPETSAAYGSFIITTKPWVQGAFSAASGNITVNEGDIIEITEEGGIYTGGGTLNYTVDTGSPYLDVTGCLLVTPNFTNVVRFIATRTDRAKQRNLPGLNFVEVDRQVAEPVDVVTGAFYENQVDLRVNGPLPIEVRRTYSSQSAAQTSEFGYGWLSGYSSFLIPSADLSTIRAADTNGSVVLFRQQGTSNTWSPNVTDNPQMANSSGGSHNLLNSTIVQVSAGNYQWNLPDGSVRTYAVQQFPIVNGGVNDPRQFPYLSTWADNRGNTLTYTFGTNSSGNDYGRINLIQSSNGSSVSFTYDSEDHIIKATASDGRTVNYTYNVLGDLTAVLQPDGSEFDYQYGTDSLGLDNHFITLATRPEGRLLQNDYDAFGRVTKQWATVDQANPTTLVPTSTFDYSVAGQTTVTDAFGNPTVYQYAPGGLITKITDPLGQTTTQTWYTATNPATGAYLNSLQSVTDKRGLLTTYQYDVQGNTTLTQIKGNLTGDSTPGATQTATTTAVYNARNLPTSIIDASGITTTFAYTDANYPYLPTQIVTAKGSTTIRTDNFAYTAQGTSPVVSKGLLQTKTVAAGSTDQAVTGYIYNSAGFMTQQTAYSGTTDPNVVTNFTYTTRGELSTATDADNRVTTYTYDAMSRPTSKVVKDENGVVLGTWTTSYNANGDVSQTVGARSSPTDTIQRYYDTNGRLEEEVASLSQAQSNGSGVTAGGLAINSYGHDFSGNLILQVDPNGNFTVMSYDAIGQMLSKNTSDLRTESYQYEPGGNVSVYVNPLGGVTSKIYTQTGKLSYQLNPDGSVLQWRYYTDGRIQQEILRNGSYWATTYDDVNRIVTRTLMKADGTILATESKAYDLRGNLVTATDPEGFVKTNTYDGLNRVKTVTGPGASTNSAQQLTTFVYGASAKTITALNGLDEQTVTTSDALGRPQQTRVLDVANNGVRTTSYSYSNDHNAVTVTEGTGTGAISRTTWTDTLNRPVLTVLGDGSFTRSVYDSNGNLIYSTDALGQTTGYAYNSLDQMITQTLPDNNVTNFTYDATGNLLTRAMANGTLTFQQSFDNAGRKLTEKLFSGSTTTRQFGYSYYASTNACAGLLQTVTAPRETITTVYDDFLRPQTVTTAGSQAETNTVTTYTYDRRSLVTGIGQSSTNNAAGPATQVNRTFDGYGQLVTETDTAGGVIYANVTQTWDAAGRRASLNDASSTLTGPLFAWQHRADGLLSQVTSNAQNYGFSYADNGLLTGRSNPFRSLSIDSRDAAGRLTQQTQTVSGAAVLVENMTWRSNSTLNSYSAARSGTGAWNESRAYQYNSRGQLLSEGFSPAAGVSSSLAYGFDGNNPGLGIRLDAKIGTGAPASWETNATVNGLGRVTSDNQTSAATGAAGGAPGHVVPASGTASGASQVNILVDGISQGQANYAGNAWSLNLNLAAGSHTLTANAVDPSGLFSTSANSTFTVTAANGSALSGSVTNSYDDDGNVTTRSWASGVSQTLTWDAQGRLIKVSQRDGSNNGYDWTAIYDGLGRRMSSAQQPVVGGSASGSATTIASIYDPQVEFLEIGVSVNGAKAWKVYGPDLNGHFGSLQGTGGLEATIVDSGGVTKGIINDQFGNGVASVSGTTVAWYATRVGAYGPLPGVAATALSDITLVAESTAWRSRRIDPTGFYLLGARYYEPTSARFLSADPMGHDASSSLYDFCSGDPVNGFDPDGRCAKAVGQFAAKTADAFINLLIGTIGTGHPDGFSEEEIANMRKMNIEDYGSWFRRMGAYDESRATKLIVEQLPANLSPAANDIMQGYGALKGESSTSAQPDYVPGGVIRDQSDVASFNQRINSEWMVGGVFAAKGIVVDGTVVEILPSGSAPSHAAMAQKAGVLEGGDDVLSSVTGTLVPGANAFDVLYDPETGAILIKSSNNFPATIPPGSANDTAIRDSVKNLTNTNTTPGTGG